MKKWAIISLSMAALAAIGCNIEVHEGFDDWDDDWDDETIQDRAEDACQPYCLRLIGCGVLSDASFSACVDLCLDRYVEDEEAVSAGCSCVTKAECDIEESESCDGDPIPDVWSEGDGALGGDGDSGDGDAGDGDGDSGGSAGGASNGAPDGPSCSNNHECDGGEDCIDGECLARCAASCQCPDGMACDEGYCQTPEEPKTECANTCECTAGDVCMEGTCQ